MTLALGPVALAAALAAAPGEPASGPVWREPAYAVPELELRCVSSPCGGVRLTDLLVTLGDPGGPREGGARLLLFDRFYLGMHADERQRVVALAAARWDLALANEDRRTGVGAEYRARRVRLRAAADRFDEAAGDGWRLDLEAALRVDPDLELVVEVIDDGRSRLGSGPSTRPTSGLAVGALWQRGQRLDVSTRLRAATVETPAGFELDSRALELAAIYQARRWLLTGDLAVEDLSGRFERRQANAGVGFTYRVTGHLVTEAIVREFHDLDLGSIRRDVAGGITYYARRFRFARGGEAGRRTVELTRRAWELGLNERRRHDDEGRRRLRERLALARRGAAVAREVEDLYRAQVDERNVALAGVSWRREADNLDGSRWRELTVFFAVPWPNGVGPHPLGHDETAADFLRFTWARSERDVSAGFSTQGAAIALDVSLRRDLALRFAWEEPAPTGLQFALQTQEPGRLTARLDYRLGI